MDKSKLIESLKWRMEMFAHDIDVIEEERKEGGIGNRYLSGQSVAYTEAFEYLEGLVEDIENGEYDNTGHWIIKDDKEQGYDIGGVKTWYIQIMCSECGFIKTAIEGRTGQYHYCPNCGCRMVEQQESEDKE